jgi:hypothetical protein
MTGLRDGLAVDARAVTRSRDGLAVGARAVTRSGDGHAASARAVTRSRDGRVTHSSRIGRVVVRRHRLSGEMTEWPKVHDWKSCVRATVPRVRIPLSPPSPLAPRKGCRARAHRPRGWLGAPGPIRTDDRRLRRPLLYPAELRARGTRALSHKERALGWGHRNRVGHLPTSCGPEPTRGLCGDVRGRD